MMPAPPCLLAHFWHIERYRWVLGVPDKTNAPTISWVLDERKIVNEGPMAGFLDGFELSHRCAPREHSTRRPPTLRIVELTADSNEIPQMAHGAFWRMQDPRAETLWLFPTRNSTRCDVVGAVAEMMRVHQCSGRVLEHGGGGEWRESRSMDPNERRQGTGPYLGILEKLCQLVVLNRTS